MHLESRRAAGGLQQVVENIERAGELEAVSSREKRSSALCTIGRPSICFGNSKDFATAAKCGPSRQFVMISGRARKQRLDVLPKQKEVGTKPGIWGFLLDVHGASEPKGQPPLDPK
jgi:hypothetical protein